MTAHHWGIPEIADSSSDVTAKMWRGLGKATARWRWR